jgi:dTDP-4-amino-4,6-dideoxygalactose transaminase
MTFVATASSVMAVGAQPVFADIESLDWPMVSAASLEKKITERTRAIIVVHYAGYLCDMPSIIELARRFDLKVIEDCAHAPGAKLADTCAGTWGDVGCFSFYSNKNLSVGEGGMLVTADSAVAHRARLLRSHGLSADTMERHRGTKTSYDVLEIGYNYRPTEIASALGLTQLPKLNEKNAERAELVAQYKQLIKGLGLNVDIPFADHVDGAVHHILPVLLPKQLDREQVMQGLRSKGVQSSIHYPPVHRLSAFSHLKPDRLAATELFGDREITLPLYPTMGGQKVRYVVESLAGCM